MATNTWTMRVSSCGLMKISERRHGLDVDVLTFHQRDSLGSHVCAYLMLVLLHVLTAMTWKLQLGGLGIGIVSLGYRKALGKLGCAASRGHSESDCKASTRCSTTRSLLTLYTIMALTIRHPSFTVEIMSTVEYYADYIT